MQGQNPTSLYMPDVFVLTVFEPWAVGLPYCYNVSAMMHIGNKIEEELRRQERSVAWFARKLYCNRQNVYDIFRRESIDTSLLRRISGILSHDFFKDLSADMDGE